MDDRITEEGRCCCGRVKFEDGGPLIINTTMHERLGDEGAFCGPVDHHTIRDQEREIERLQARVEALEGGINTFRLAVEERQRLNREREG